MKLYEVNAQLLDLLEALEPDPETGEIPADEDELVARINALSMERLDILQYLAKQALNTKSAIASLRDEEKRLKDRRQHEENRHDRLINLLDRECGGQKTDLGVATLAYRRTSHVEITDNAAAIAWLKEHGYDAYYRVPPPEIMKAAVSKLIDSGEKIPGVEKVTTVSCFLK